MRVLVVGGGVAGVEALATLSGLGGDGLKLALLDSAPTCALYEELGIELHEGELAGVDQKTRSVRLVSGGTLDYDQLLVACGACPVAPYAGVHTLGLGPLPDHFAALRPGRLSIVVPPAVAWTLPAYQLALTAVSQIAMDVEVITPERSPLEAFGGRASLLAGELLANSGVQVLPRCTIPEQSDLVTLLDNVIALPLLRGPSIAGLPVEGDGFLGVDGLGRVVGAIAVHAAGDVTSRVLKGDGLAAQDGAIAASDMARRAGLMPRGEPSPRVLAGELVASDGTAVHMRRVLDGHDAGVASRQPLRTVEQPVVQRVAHQLCTG